MGIGGIATFTILNLGYKRDENLASGTGRFTPGKRALSTH
jgi:hypothetical protein